MITPEEELELKLKEKILIQEGMITNLQNQIKVYEKLVIALEERIKMSDDFIGKLKGCFERIAVNDSE